MQAIETKFLGATNTKGSRIKAISGSGQSVTVSWCYDLDAQENHVNAAKALMKKLDWNYGLVTGGLKNSYVHVLVKE